MTFEQDGFDFEALCGATPTLEDSIMSEDTDCDFWADIADVIYPDIQDTSTELHETTDSIEHLFA